MSEKLTPWFDSRVKPVHIGVYEVAPDASSPWYSYWDGVYFQGLSRTIDEAIYAICEKWNHGPLKWRGLAEKP